MELKVDGNSEHVTEKKIPFVTYQITRRKHPFLSYLPSNISNMEQGDNKTILVHFLFRLFVFFIFKFT